MIFGRFERAGHRLAAITLTEGLFLQAALDETWSAGLWAEKSYIVINLLCALAETEPRPRPPARRWVVCLRLHGRFERFLQFEEGTLWCLSHRWRYTETAPQGSSKRPQIYQRIHFTNVFSDNDFWKGYSP